MMLDNAAFATIAALAIFPIAEGGNRLLRPGRKKGTKKKGGKKRCKHGGTVTPFTNIDNLRNAVNAYIDDREKWRASSDCDDVSLTCGEIYGYVKR
jgi:hypothetical protein